MFDVAMILTVFTVIAGFFLILFIFFYGYFSSKRQEETMLKEKRELFRIEDLLKKIKLSFMGIKINKPQLYESLEPLADRYSEIHNKINALASVDYKISKESFVFINLATYHEIEALKKVVSTLLKGVAVSEPVLLQTLEEIIVGLEEHYERFVNFTTEDLVKEIELLKDLRKLEGEGRLDTRYINVLS